MVSFNEVRTIGVECSCGAVVPATVDVLGEGYWSEVIVKCRNCKARTRVRSRKGECDAEYRFEAVGP